MTKAVLLGGNGYLGRVVSDHWLKQDPTIELYVVSRSGKNQLINDRIINLKADVTDYAAVEQVLPEQVDYIIDFVGRPEKDPQAFHQINDLPAEVMLKLAQKYQVKAMGFIGGILGDKAFVTGKAKIAARLEASGIKTAVVNPTLVYGSGRNDSMTKLVPLLKFFGIFSKKFRPVTADSVADELLTKLLDK
ncbi:NAD-dependent epimerase/dehydratase family protein [Lactobacillus corticis]|uniref:UDP-glucose 4-epimerase n=1 Tax=Lactobacillus corticis TaxID=2201249 RepID=A0A916QF31_9LACO|nr:NAD-dependent epimerase/dehydratase family protein [Lactobacillus corticis]GFZ26126.1 UDP-glucose 4-epimerase [Lactobacillus corticis]